MLVASVGIFHKFLRGGLLSAAFSKHVCMWCQKYTFKEVCIQGRNIWIQSRFKPKKKMWLGSLINQSRPGEELWCRTSVNCLQVRLSLKKQKKKTERLNQTLSKSNKTPLFESSSATFLFPSPYLSSSCFYCSHPAQIKLTPHLWPTQKATSVQPATSKQGKHGSAVNDPTRLMFTSATRVEFNIARAPLQRRNT